MTRKYDKWATQTRTSHGAPCLKCGRRTYAADGVCKVCRLTTYGLTAVSKLPEDYLMLCAAELLRRHNERDALLRKLSKPREPVSFVKVEEAA